MILPPCQKNKTGTPDTAAEASSKCQPIGLQVAGKLYIMATGAGTSGFQPAANGLKPDEILLHLALKLKKPKKSVQSR